MLQSKLCWKKLSDKKRCDKKFAPKIFFCNERKLLGRGPGGGREGGPMRGLELIMWSHGQWKTSEKTAPDGTNCDKPQAHKLSQQIKKIGWPHHRPQWFRPIWLASLDQFLRGENFWQRAIFFGKSYSEEKKLFWIRKYPPKHYRRCTSCLSVFEHRQKLFFFYIKKIKYTKNYPCTVFILKYSLCVFLCSPPT